MTLIGARHSRNVNATPGGSWIAYIGKSVPGGCGGTDVRGKSKADAEQEFRSEIASGTTLHGHHIVAKGDDYPAKTKARRILCKHGIDPYSGCENLVIAPNRSHTHDYFNYVCKQLQDADPRGRAEVITTLKDIADRFAANNIPGGSTCS